MAYALRCADSGMDCPGQFTTKTEDELMQHVELHVREAHPDMELTPRPRKWSRAWSAQPDLEITATRPVLRRRTARCGSWLRQPPAAMLASYTTQRTSAPRGASACSAAARSPPLGRVVRSERGTVECRDPCPGPPQSAATLFFEVVHRHGRRRRLYVKRSVLACRSTGGGEDADSGDTAMSGQLSRQPVRPSRV